MLIDLTSSPADPLIAELRAREFARLDASNLAYLDYAGRALHADSQIVAHQARLRSAVLGNPHSEHEPSRASSRIIAGARDAVLKFFGVSPATHAVCFTANATAAIKLVAESSPFAPGTTCVLSADNHNSVNGIREIARRRGAAIRYLPLDADLRLLDADAQLDGCASAGGGLFAYPAQSNFSGVRHPLGLVAQARSLGFDVLLDAAAFAPANALSLRECPADFVAVSFYKIFGYPTGVGALIARRDALRRLRRPWFSGGTVEYASVQAAMHRLHDGDVAFEDGTPNFLGISALEDGFAFIERIGLDRIRAHVERLTGMLLDGLMTLTHCNGRPVVRIYGPPGMADRGCAVAFNAIDRTGRPIPYDLLETRARQRGVGIRGGCFCNPGAAEAAFGFDGDRASACLERLAGRFSAVRFSECLGQDTAVGAIRASAGLATSADDVARCIDLVASFRD